MDQGGYAQRRPLPGQRDVEVLAARPLTRPATGRVLAHRDHGSVATYVVAESVEAVGPLTARQRLSGWRRDHYVADQLIRVGLIALAALSVVALIVGTVAALVGWAIGQVSGVAVSAGSLLGGLAVAVLLLLAVKSKGGAKTPSGQSDHGYHYGPCKH